MATTARYDPAALIDIRQLLLDHGGRIPYVQVIRLLHLYLSKLHPGLEQEEIGRMIRVHPHLGLDFPGTDVTRVKELRQDPPLFQVTATFLGLYGSSSPLPTFYTEDLMEERREERSGSRGFLDVINQQFYDLYYRVWEKYTFTHRLAEDRNDRDYLILFSLLGLGHREMHRLLEHDRRFLAYIGLACQQPHSAAGLRGLVSDMLGEPSVRVKQCVSYSAVISEEQRCFLGTANSGLGEDAHLGSRVRDRMGKFQLMVSPRGADRFQELLPDRPAYALIRECVLFYVDQPLLWDLVLQLDREEVETCQPGERSWGCLGWNTWIFSGDTCPNDGQVQFRNQKSHTSQ